MNKLTNTTQQKILAMNVSQASSFTARAKGLLGKTSFDDANSLWIHRCKDIHTCFMRFPIDAIFVNKKLQVTSVHTNIRPWKFIFDWKAHSVFEFNAGVIDDSNVTVGDQLNVGS